MLSFKHRLKSRVDFARVLRRGNVFYGGLFNLKFFPSRLLISRFGFVVSNKISKKATKRNRIKRLLREVIREKIPEIKTGYDIIFFVKSEILNYDDLEVFKKEILETLKKANLLEDV